MTILELKEKRSNLQDELQNIITNGETEKRELNEEENSKMAEIRKQIDELDTQIEKLEKENEELAKRNNKNNTEKKETRKMITLAELVREVANGQVKDEHRSFINGNNINYRAAIQATVSTHGEEIVPEDKAPLDVAIRNASVLGVIGAKHFGNAVGNISLPKYSGSSAAWAGSENAQAADGAGTFDEVVLSPKRLTSVITVSRQALAQTNDDLEAILISDLAKAIAEKLDETVFGAESGTTARPAGLFYDSAYTETGTSLSAITYDDVLDLEAKVEKKNGRDYIFITEPAVKQMLRGVQMASGLEMVFNNNEIDGRKTVVSNSVNDKSLMVLCPDDLVWATWDYNMTVDPYTLADYNEIRIVVNYLVDAKLRRDRIAAEIFS